MILFDNSADPLNCVRRGASGDSVEIVNCDLKSHEMPMEASEWVLTEQMESLEIYLSLKDGNIKGYCLFIPAFDDTQNYLTIERMAVNLNLPHAERVDHFNRLIQTAWAKAVMTGKKELRIWLPETQVGTSDAYNTSRFLAPHGLRATGTEAKGFFEYGKWVPAILYSKPVKGDDYS